MVAGVRGFHLPGPGAWPRPRSPCTAAGCPPSPGVRGVPLGRWDHRRLPHSMRKGCSARQPGGGDTEDAEGGPAPAAGGTSAPSAQSQDSSTEQPRKEGAHHWSPWEGTRRTGGCRGGPAVTGKGTSGPSDQTGGGGRAVIRASENAFLQENRMGTEDILLIKTAPAFILHCSVSASSPPAAGLSSVLAQGLRASVSGSLTAFSSFCSLVPSPSLRWQRQASPPCPASLGLTSRHVCRTLQRTGKGGGGASRWE